MLIYICEPTTGLRTELLLLLGLASARAESRVIRLRAATAGRTRDRSRAAGRCWRSSGVRRCNGHVALVTRAFLSVVRADNGRGRVTAAARHPITLADQAPVYLFGSSIHTDRASS